MAATAEQLGMAINGKTVQAPTGEWHISVVRVQMPVNSTIRVLNLTLIGAVEFSLQLEIAGEALLGLQPDQDIGSWLLRKISSYLAFNPGIHNGDSRVFLVTQS